jgi:ribonuclease VapC
MFVDASAIVAIVTREPEADTLADVLESAQAPITSPIAIFEAALGICRKRHASVDEAEQDVAEFLGLAGVRTVSITDKEAHTALAAFSLRQGTRPSRTTQPRRLLRLRGGEELPDGAAVQGRRFR